jgi:cell division protein FtsB
VSTENKKLRAKVEVLKEQVQDLMNDQAEMARAQKSLKTPKA